jgi:hypothetical protein
MYSVVFAMTVILGIAVTNMFLGFAAALLLGRGPRRWSDVDRAIVIQPVVLNLPRFRRRPRVERIEVPLAVTEAAPPHEAPRASSTPEPQVEDAAPGDGYVGRSVQDAKAKESAASESADNAAAASQATPVATTTVPETLILRPAVQTLEEENKSPAEALQEQLQQWRGSESVDEDVPSLSGLSISLVDVDTDSPVGEILSETIHARIKGQVRRDRRVLRIEPGCFVWFSPDVLPDDALMPVERIRQLLDHTRFLDHGEAVRLSIVAGVVQALAEDDSESLLDRLRSAWHLAQQEGAYPTALDTGSGPNGVKPYAIEVEETDCELSPAG